MYVHNKNFNPSSTRQLICRMLASVPKIIDEIEKWHWKLLI